MGDNFTAIPIGSQATAELFNSRLEDLDTAIGDRTELTTTEQDNLVGAVNEVYAYASQVNDTLSDADTALTGSISELQGRVYPSLNVDGSLKAAVAGNGLSNTAGVLAVGVDGSTIEINSDALRVKDGGIGTAKIADTNVTATKIATTAIDGANFVWDPFNEMYNPGFGFGGALRWLSPTAISVVVNSDGSRYLRFDQSIAVAAGKRLPLSEIGAVVGDVLVLGMRGVPSATSTWYLAGRFYDSSNVALGTQTSGTTMSMVAGTAQTMPLTVTVPSSAVSLAIYPVRATGTGTIDAIEWMGTRADYLPARASRTANDAALRSQHVIEGIVWDATFAYRNPGTDFGGRTRWVNSSVLSIITDSNNIYGGRTIEQAYSVGTTFAGKRLYLDEIHATEGDWIECTAQVTAASGSYLLAGRFYDVSGTAVGSQWNGPTVSPAGIQVPLTVKSTAVPATAVSVRIYVVRVSGSVAINWYSLTGRVLSARGAAHPAAFPIDWIQEIVDAKAGQATLLAGITAASATATAFPPSQEVYGRHLLRDTRAQKGKIKQAVSGEQLHVAVIGDSWVNNDRITTPLRNALIAALPGTAGAGWISANQNIGVPATTISGVATARGGTGTWSVRDNEHTPVGYGPDIGSAYTSTVGHTKTFTSYLTDASIIYLVQPNGGSFKWRVDAGSWSSDVSTDGTLAAGFIDIPSQSAGSHTVTVEVTVAGSAGVEVAGCMTWALGVNGVMVSKIGNGGATAAQYASIDATIWQAMLAKIAPNLVILVLGTNDDSADIVPATFQTSVETIVDRIRAARASTDVLILSPTANGLAAGTYAMSQYVSALRAAAVSKSVAMADSFLTIPDYTIGNGRGLFADTAHVNAVGGQVITEAPISMILNV